MRGGSGGLRLDRTPGRVDRPGLPTRRRIHPLAVDEFPGLPPGDGATRGTQARRTGLGHRGGPVASGELAKSTGRSEPRSSSGTVGSPPGTCGRVGCCHSTMSSSIPACRGCRPRPRMSPHSRCSGSSVESFLRGPTVRDRVRPTPISLRPAARAVHRACGLRRSRPRNHAGVAFVGSGAPGTVVDAPGARIQDRSRGHCAELGGGEPCGHGARQPDEGIRREIESIEEVIRSGDTRLVREVCGDPRSGLERFVELQNRARRESGRGLLQRVNTWRSERLGWTWL